MFSRLFGTTSAGDGAAASPEDQLVAQFSTLGEIVTTGGAQVSTPANHASTFSNSASQWGQAPAQSAALVDVTTTSNQSQAFNNRSNRLRPLSSLVGAPAPGAAIYAVDLTTPIVTVLPSPDTYIVPANRVVAPGEPTDYQLFITIPLLLVEKTDIVVNIDFKNAAPASILYTNTTAPVSGGVSFEDVTFIKPSGTSSSINVTFYRMRTTSAAQRQQINMRMVVPGSSTALVDTSTLNVNVTVARLTAPGTPVGTYLNLGTVSIVEPNVQLSAAYAPVTDTNTVTVTASIDNVGTSLAYFRNVSPNPVVTTGPSLLLPPPTGAPGVVYSAPVITSSQGAGFFTYDTTGLIKINTPLPPGQAYDFTAKWTATPAAASGDVITTQPILLYASWPNTDTRRAYQVAPSIQTTLLAPVRTTQKEVSDRVGNSSVTYTLTLTNPADAQPVNDTIIDVFPAGITGVIGDPVITTVGAVSLGPSSVTATQLSGNFIIGPDSSISYTYTCTIDDPATAAVVINDVDASEFFPATSNTYNVPQPLLRTAKVIRTTAPAITDFKFNYYYLDITNIGSAIAPTIDVNDVRPAGLTGNFTYVPGQSTLPAGTSFVPGPAGADFTGVISNLAPNATARLAVSWAVDYDTVITLITVDNSVTASIPFTSTTSTATSNWLVVAPQLAINKIALTEQSTDEGIYYQIFVSNPGNGDLTTDITVNDISGQIGTFALVPDLSIIPFTTNLLLNSPAVPFPMTLQGGLRAGATATIGIFCTNITPNVDNEIINTATATTASPIPDVEVTVVIPLPPGAGVTPEVEVNVTDLTYNHGPMQYGGKRTTIGDRLRYDYIFRNETSVESCVSMALTNVTTTFGVSILSRLPPLLPSGAVVTAQLLDVNQVVIEYIDIVANYDNDNLTFSGLEGANIGTAAAGQTLLIPYVYRVVNQTENIAGYVFQPQTDFNYVVTVGNQSSPGSRQVISPYITLIEPSVNITKTRAIPSVVVQAGGTIVYNIQVVNVGRATAFEVIVDDEDITHQQNFSSYTINILPGGWNTVPAQELRFVIGELAAGASALFQISGRIRSDIPDATVVTNKCSVTYRSVQVPNQDAEYARDGSDGAQPGGANKLVLLNRYYAEWRTNDEVLRYRIAKQVLPAPDGMYNPGDTVTFAITVAVPRGSHSSPFMLIEVPSAPLLFSSVTATGNAAASQGFLTANFAGSFGAVTIMQNSINVASLVVNNTATNANNSFVVFASYTIPANTTLNTFTNRVSVSDVSATTPPAQIAQAILVVRKSHVAPVYVNQPVRYTTVIEHAFNSTATGYNLGLVTDPGSTTPGVYSNIQVVVERNSVAPNLIPLPVVTGGASISMATVSTLPVDASIVITYDFVPTAPGPFTFDVADNLTYYTRDSLDPIYQRLAADNDPVTILPLKAVLYLEKEATTAIVAGQSATYELRVGHALDSALDATNVVLNDTIAYPVGQGTVTSAVVHYLPPYQNPDLTPAPVVQPNITPTGFTLAMGTLARGRTAVVTLTVAVTQAATGNGTNNATLFYDDPAPITIPVSVTGSIVPYVIPEAQVYLRKTRLTEPVVLGQPIRYRIELGHKTGSASAAYNYYFEDDSSQGTITLDSVVLTPPVPGSPVPGIFGTQLILANLTLQLGSTYVVDYTVTLPPNPSLAGNNKVTSTFRPYLGGPIRVGPSDIDVYNITSGGQPNAVLTFRKTQLSKPVVAGGLIDYEVEVSHDTTSRATATNISFTDTSTQGTLVNVITTTTPVLTGAVEPVVAGASYTVTNLTLPQGVVYLIRYSVQLPAVPDLVGSNMLNYSYRPNPLVPLVNGSTGTNYVVEPIVVPQAVLFATKSHTPLNPDGGEEMVFTVTIAHNPITSEAEATGVEFTDTLNGAGTLGTPVVTSLPPGYEPTVTTSGLLIESAAPFLLPLGVSVILTYPFTPNDTTLFGSNAVKGTYLPAPASPIANFEAFDDYTVAPAGVAEIVVTKTRLTEPVLVDQPIDYLITFRHTDASAAAATGISLTDIWSQGTASKIVTNSTIAGDEPNVVSTGPVSLGTNGNNFDLLLGAVATVRYSITLPETGYALTDTNRVSGVYKNSTTNPLPVPYAMVEDTYIIDPTLQPAADLYLLKQHTPEPYIGGPPLDYTFELGHKLTSTLAASIINFADVATQGVVSAVVLAAQPPAAFPLPTVEAGPTGFTLTPFLLPLGARLTGTYQLALPVAPVNGSNTITVDYAANPNTLAQVDVTDTYLVGPAPTAQLIGTKTRNTAPVRLGEPIEYTLVISHTVASAADATMITFTDTSLQGTVLDATATSSIPGYEPTLVGVGSQLSGNIPLLPLGVFIIIKYLVMLPAVPALAGSNTFTGSYAPVAEGPATGSFGANDSYTIVPADQLQGVLYLNKDRLTNPVYLGTPIDYEVSIGSGLTSQGPAYQLALVDTASGGTLANATVEYVPPYVPAVSSLTTVGNVLSYSVDVLPKGCLATIRYQLLEPVLAGGSNQAVLNYQGSSIGPAAPQLTDEDSYTVTVAPAVAYLYKERLTSPVLEGEPIQYRLTAGHDDSSVAPALNFNLVDTASQGTVSNVVVNAPPSVTVVTSVVNGVLTVEPFTLPRCAVVSISYQTNLPANPSSEGSNSVEWSYQPDAISPITPQPPLLNTYTVIEPEGALLYLNKTRPTDPVLLGEPIDYTLEIGGRGLAEADAFMLDLVDVSTQGTVTNASVSYVPPIVLPDDSLTTSGSSLVYKLALLPAGTIAKISYQVMLGVAPDLAGSNIATLNYQSEPETPAQPVVATDNYTVELRPALLYLTKTRTTDPVVLGAPILYRAEFGHLAASRGTATVLRLLDTPSQGVVSNAQVVFGPPEGMVAVVAGKLVYTSPALAVGSTIVIQYQVDLPVGAALEGDNVAVLDYQDTPLTQASATDTNSYVINPADQPRAVINVDKLRLTDPPIFGQQIAYRIIVDHTPTSKADATNVEAVDVWSAGTVEKVTVSYNGPVSEPAVITLSATSFSVLIPLLPLGYIATVDYKLTPTMLVGSNEAVVTYNISPYYAGTDVAGPVTNTFVINEPVGPPAILYLTKELVSGSVYNVPFRYRSTIAHNLGSGGSATQLLVDDSATQGTPELITVSYVPPFIPAFNPPTFPFTLPVLPLGVMARIDYSLTLVDPTATSVTNTTTVTYDDNSNVVAKRLGAKKLGATIQLIDSVTTPLVPATLTLRKSVTPLSYRVGDIITFLIDYANVGDLPLTGAQLRETITANYLSYYAPGSSAWSVVSGGFVLSLPPLAPRSSGQARFQVLVNGPLPYSTTGRTDYINTVTLAVAGGPTVTATATVVLIGAPQIVVTKPIVAGTVQTGSDFTYEVTVRNTGNASTPTPLIIVETIPAGTVWRPSAPWIQMGNKLTITITTPLAPGQSISYLLTFGVLASAATAIYNTVNVTGADGSVLATVTVRDSVIPSIPTPPPPTPPPQCYKRC